MTAAPTIGDSVARSWRGRIAHHRTHCYREGFLVSSPGRAPVNPGTGQGGGTFRGGGDQEGKTLGVARSGGHCLGRKQKALLLTADNLRIVRYFKYTGWLVALHSLTIVVGWPFKPLGREVAGFGFCLGFCRRPCCGPATVCCSRGYSTGQRALYKQPAGRSTAVGGGSVDASSSSKNSSRQLSEAQPASRCGSSSRSRPQQQQRQAASN